MIRVFYVALTWFMCFTPRMNNRTCWMWETRRWRQSSPRYISWSLIADREHCSWTCWVPATYLPIILSERPCARPESRDLGSGSTCLNTTTCSSLIIYCPDCAVSRVTVDLWRGSFTRNLFAEGQGSDRTGSGSGLDLGHSDRLSESLGLMG